MPSPHFRPRKTSSGCEIWSSLSFNGREIICKQTKMEGEKFKWTQITLSIVSCKLDSNVISTLNRNVYIFLIIAECFHHLFQAHWRRWQIIKIIIIKHCRFIFSFSAQRENFSSRIFFPKDGKYSLSVLDRWFASLLSSEIFIPKLYSFTRFIIKIETFFQARKY